MTRYPRKTITVVGTGLIGGSMAIRLHEKKIAKHIIGVDANEENAAEALKRELVDEVLPLDQAIKISDVILLAIPVDAIVDVLPRIMDHIHPDQIVMDVGSTKKSILNIIENHSNRAQFVSTHPMWGTEHSGPKAAVAGAFDHRTVVLCSTSYTDTLALDWVRYMYEKIGMKVIEMNPEDHDLHTAYISHISHISSFALANTVLQKEKHANTIFDLASSGFESTVRLAKSDDNMWVPIFQQNKIHILEVLDELIHQLGRFKIALSENDSQQLRNIILEANQIRKILK